MKKKQTEILMKNEKNNRNINENTNVHWKNNFAC